MTKVNFESSTSCQARCTFCPRYDMTRPMGEMSDELFHKIIKDGKEARVYRYSPFMNGEPFVFPRIWEWLDYMEKEGVQVGLYTNAEYLDVDRLIKYKNIWYVSCSINAATAETHKKVMRGPDFNTCVSNTKDLIKRAPFYVRASFVRCDENIHEENAFREMFPRRAKVCGFANWIGDRDAKVARKGNKIPCYVLLTQMFILWDGRVVPCCMSYDAQMVIGDVNKQTIREIWNNNKWMREKHKNHDFNIPICLKCNYNVDG